MNLDDVIVGLDPSGRPLAAGRPRPLPRRPALLAVDRELGDEIFDAPGTEVQ
jgi:hypothetical protein